MKVIKKEPDKFPEVVDIPNELDTLQEAVGGYIEVFPVATDLVILCDEEGRIDGKPFNCNLCGADFCGTIMFVGVDGEEFTDVSERVVRLFKDLWEK